MKAGARRMTRQWLSAHQEVLSVDVPQGCVAFVAGLRHVEPILAMSRAAFDDTALKRRAIRRYITRAHALVLGLMADEHMAAYCVAEFHRKHRKVYIVEICVHPAHKGRGHGAWLYGRIDAISTMLGYWTLASNIRVDNLAALALNLKCGLSIAARIKEYYEDYSDGFYLTKRLG